MSLAVSADPAFHGDDRLWNPEQLVVLATASCQLLSFLAVAARARLDVVRYEPECYITNSLTTDIVVEPTIEVLP